MPTFRRTTSWIVGLVVLIVGVFATLATAPCPDDRSAVASLSAAVVAEGTATLASDRSPEPCGETVADPLAALPSVGASATPAKAPQAYAVTAEIADRHRSGCRLLTAAGMRASCCRPASLAIAVLAVARI